jgi:hypothetical protein
MSRRPLDLELLERRDVPVTTFVWDGGGTDQLWSTGSNWVGDVAPTVSTADPTGVVIQFNGNTQSTMDVNGLTVGCSVETFLTGSGQEHEVVGQHAE